MKYTYVLFFTAVLLICSDLEKVCAKPSASISRQTKSAQVYVDLGKKAMDENDFHKAKLFFLEASRLNPNDEFIFVLAGFAARGSSEYDEAIRLFKKAIALRPDDDRGYIGIGEAYNWIKRYEEAIAAFKKAATIDNKCYIAHIALADIYYKIGKHEDCRLSINNFNGIVDNLNYSSLSERQKRLIEKAKKRFANYLTIMD
jgi:tetratricopeptide (TPR) repeat protein